MYTSNSPTINLHGEIRDIAGYLVDEFIRDNKKQRIQYIGIIHGRSSDILKTKVHEVLRKNEYVESYSLDIWNPGLTIVKLKK